MYWSVRRELWENRSIYVAPLIVAAVVLFGVLIRTMTLPRRMNAILALDPAEQREALTMPFSAVAGALIVTVFMVAVFCCLDALQSERRDRSLRYLHADGHAVAEHPGPARERSSCRDTLETCEFLPVVADGL